MAFLLKKLSIAQKPIIDNTFGSNGIITTDLQDERNDVAKTMVVQTDGKIILAGYSTKVQSGGSIQSIALVRYNKTGSVDQTFGTNGIVIKNIGIENSLINAMALQTDGKIVAVGYLVNKTSQSDFALIRFNSNGTLDNSFGDSGIVSGIVSNRQDQANSIAIQPDGKILVAGFTTNENYTDCAILRYNSDGSIDSTFGISGRIIKSFGSADDQINAIALQPNGKILIAGVKDTTFSDGTFICSRFNSNGALDSTFGVGGLVTTTSTIGIDNTVNSIALQPDGKIILAGSSKYIDTRVFMALRYDINGALDNTFGTGGRVYTKLTGDLTTAYSVLLQKDNKIILGGNTYRGLGFDFAAVRYNSNGTLDSTFGYEGIAINSINGYNDEAYCMAIQSDDKILLGGYSKIINGSEDFALTRYNPSNGLSINEGSLNNYSYSIFPNPTNYQLTIMNPENNIREFQIFNSTGKIVYSDFMNNNQKTINIDNFTKGVYFIRLVSATSVKTEKLIIED